MKRTFLFTAALAALTLVGCGTSQFAVDNFKLMKPATETVTAASNETTVTFYRPDDGSSYFCPVIAQANEKRTRFIATIAKEQKHTVVLPAGQHIFAFLGEENHILQGFFREGKHYYVRLNFSEGLYGSIFKPTVLNTQDKKTVQKAASVLNTLTAIVPTKHAIERYQTYEELRKAAIGMIEAKTRASSGENFFVSKDNAFDAPL